MSIAKEAFLNVFLKNARKGYIAMLKNKFFENF